LDPNQAIANVVTLEQLVARDTARQRFNMALLLTFGVTALLLAAAGVWSVVAESVSLRTREIAIRLALGAERRALTRHFVNGILRFVLIGEFLGLLISFATGRFLAGLLYAVGPRDPLVLTAVFVFLLVVSASASAIPAWIAAGQEPIAKKLA
jgi:ABC-type antimicrobial peptide transport system permease subunit